MDHFKKKMIQDLAKRSKIINLITLTGSNTFYSRSVFHIESGKLHETSSWVILLVFKVGKNSGITVGPRKIGIALIRPNLSHYLKEQRFSYRLLDLFIFMLKFGCFSYQ